MFTWAVTGMMTCGTVGLTQGGEHSFHLCVLTVRHIGGTQKVFNRWISTFQSLYRRMLLSSSWTFSSEIVISNSSEKMLQSTCCLQIFSYCSGWWRKLCKAAFRWNQLFAACMAPTQRWSRPLAIIHVSLWLCSASLVTCEAPVKLAIFTAWLSDWLAGDAFMAYVSVT